MEKIKNLANYLITNFGPTLAFYLVNHFYGLRAAIATGLLVTIVEIIRFKFLQEKMSLFFIFSTTITLLFGILDLTVKAPVFLKFEAGLSNLVFALFFASTLFQKKSIVQEFAEQQGRIDDQESEDKTFFFRFMTVLWSLYFLCKAIVFTLININNSIETGFLLRVLIGNISFAVMLFISIGLSRSIWRLLSRIGIMPSSRA